MTATVRDLKAGYPSLVIDVRTSCPPLWENNPHIAPLDEDDPTVEVFDIEYPLIHRSNQGPWHFLQGFIEDASNKLCLPLHLKEFRGDIHLSAIERSLDSPVHRLTQRPTRYWILVAGGKFDFTTKWWNPASYQAVVDALRDDVLFVQCGGADHWHPRLRGVLDLVGKTSLREFIQLMYHADGVLCPVTFAMHLAAAVETKPGRPYTRPCVVVAGGREPPHWESYPHHQYIHTVGALDCCAEGGCWRPLCQTEITPYPEDESHCVYPIRVENDLLLPRCMTMISPQHVVDRVRLYYDGGILAHDNLLPEFYSTAERELRFTR